MKRTLATNYWRIISEHKDIAEITLHKGTNISCLTRRLGTVFVKNGNDWLLESNKKLFTNVLDDMSPRFGKYIQYRETHSVSKPHIFRRLISLLLAGKYISKESALAELTALKLWEEEQKRKRRKYEFKHIAEEMGIKLTPNQIKILK